MLLPVVPPDPLLLLPLLLPALKLAIIATSLLGMVTTMEDTVLSVVTVLEGLTVQLLKICPLGGLFAFTIICVPAT